MKKKSLEFVFTGPPMEGQIEPTASSTATIISHDTITRPNKHLLLACQRGDRKEANLLIASRWLCISLTVSVINSARGKNGFLPYD
jgi:hypothetical protein